MAPIAFSEAVNVMSRRHVIESIAWIFLQILPLLPSQLQSAYATNQALMGTIHDLDPQHPQFVSSRIMGQRRNGITRIIEFY